MEGPEGLLQGSDRGEQLVERKRLPQEALPRNRPNTRVKDLPDLALLATAQAIDAKRLRAALEQTFTYRKTHALPPSVPAPLEAWTTPYQALARDEQLSWATLDEVLAATHTCGVGDFIGSVHRSPQRHESWGPERLPRSA